MRMQRIWNDKVFKYNIQSLDKMIASKNNTTTVLKIRKVYMIFSSAGIVVGMVLGSFFHVNKKKMFTIFAYVAKSCMGRK